MYLKLLAFALALLLPVRAWAATGDLLFYVTAAANEAPTASAATFDTEAGEGNSIALVLDFNDAADESAEFAGHMPGHYDGGGMTCDVMWSSEAATTGAAGWLLGFKSVTDDADDMDTKAFAADNSVSATTASAAGELDYAEITFTDGADMDSIAVDEYFRANLTRDGDGSTVTDDLVGDALFWALACRET